MFESIAGLEMGGIPIATTLALKTGASQLFVRKKAKNYGTCRQIEGTDDLKHKVVVVIEDIITTGGAVSEAIKALRDEGAFISDVICGTGESIEVVSSQLAPPIGQSLLYRKLLLRFKGRQGFFFGPPRAALKN